ncbi:ATP-binding protein [Marinobacter sp. SS5-14b]|uniref:ATP-binding protein n=1 Tax=Marinobacter sp. SS5-14b TaxID=3050456 RepID=UPI0026DF5A3D|nr:ATP-binding protein [Marinobacter sp. SS5-14b]
MKWSDLTDQHDVTRGVDNPSPDARMLLQLYLCRLMGAPDAKLSFDREDASYQANLLGLFDVQPEKMEDFMAALKNRQQALEQQIASATVPPVLGFDRLLETLQARLNLKPAELKMLTFIILGSQFHWFRNVINDVMTVDVHHTLRVIAWALREPVSAVSDALDAEKTLTVAGLLSEKRMHARAEVGDLIMPGPLLGRLMEVLTERSEEDGDVARLIFETICPQAPAASFPLSAFSGMGDLQLVIDYLRRVVDSGAPGANILLYGPPGTGKTQLALSLAASMDLPLLEVPTSREDKRALTGSARLDAACLAQSFLKDRSQVVVLFDEMEDAFRDHRALAKGWFNKLLEQNRVPTIWISNRVDHMDAAFLRRFTLVLPIQDDGTRRKSHVAGTLNGLPVTPDWVAALAKKPWMTPALANNLRDVGSLLPVHQPQRNQQRLVSVLEDRLSLARGEPVKVSVEPKEQSQASLPFSTDWLQTSPNLRNVERMLRRRQPARLCLYGPPGAGKTAYASELAKRLDRPFNLVSGSDLQSCFVGETEKNIAGMFTEAERTGAVLLLDEADTFLFSRDTAYRSWEVAMTNEFMVCMERFKGVFLATTNRMESLDTAVMRRFQLKVRFGYLDSTQLRGLLAACVADPDKVAELSESALADFTAITPGLVQTALNQIQLLGLRPVLRRVLKTLEEEQVLQSGEVGKRGIGFHS